MRWVVIAALVLVIVSLFTSLFFVYKDRGTGSKRAVRALALRVGFSVAIFVFLMLSYKMGWVGSGRL
jgi:hypothetical protein